MNKLTTALECYNAAMQALDLAKAVQAALLREDVEAVTPGAQCLLMGAAAGARASLDRLATDLEKLAAHQKVVTK
jgi:hypothetical protein